MPAHAQKQTETPDTTTRYKWEVATDLLWLLDKNTMPATSVFFRKHNEKGAWRLRVGGEFQSSLLRTKWEDYPWKTEEKIFHPVVRVGYEFHRKSGRNMFYYGAEAHLEYNHKKIDIIKGSNTGIDYIRTQGFEKEATFGLVGLVGIKHTFCKRWAVFGEANIFPHFSRWERWKYDVEYPTDDPMTTLETSTIIRKWNLDIVPLSYIGFSYSF